MGKIILLSVAILLSGYITVAQVNLSNGLLAYYPFNGNANDESGNGNNGTTRFGDYYNYDRFNNPNSSISFLGYNFIDVNTTLGNFGLNDFTISTWIYTPDNSKTSRIFSKRKSDNWDLPFISFSLSSLNGITWELSQGSYNYSYGGGLGSTTAINNNTWYNTILMRKNNTVNLYLNGSLYSTQDVSALNCDNNFISSIGMYRDGSGAFQNLFLGAMDDFRIYNRAVNDSEIQALYTENQTQTVDLNNGLVAYYPFNGNANDESGHGNNGTIIGGNFNLDINSNLSALSLSGVNSYVDMNWDGKIGTGSESFSISFWFKTNKLGESIIRNGQNGPSLGYLFQVTSNNNLAFALGGSPSYNNCFGFVTTLTGFDDNQWRFVTITVDRASRTSKLYLNGESIQIIKNPNYPYSGTIDDNGYTYNFGNLPTLSTSNTLPFTLGSAGKGSEYFSGSLDEVRMYNRVLNYAEIQALYTENQTQTVDLNNGLVTYYPFNGNANDESGNGLNGSVIGNVTLTTDRLNQANKAYYFNGEVNDYITVNHNQILNFNSSFTISVWAKLEGQLSDANQRYEVISKGRDVIDGYNITFDYSDYITNSIPGTSFAFTNNFPRPPYGWGETNSVHPNTTSGTDGQWINIIAIADIQSQIAKIYLNGILKGSIAISSIKIENVLPLLIGKHDNNSGYPYPFKGKIDDIRIYNRALNDAEIQALALEGCGSIVQPDIVLSNNQLSTNSITGYSYQWYLNGTSIAGANQNVLSGQLQEGVYKVKTIIANCGVESAPFPIGAFFETITVTTREVITTTSPPVTITSMNVVTVTVYKIITVDENGNTITGVDYKKAETTPIVSYPNPSNGIFTIESDFQTFSLIEIYNSSGRTVHESRIKEINIYGVPVGLYLLKIYDNENRILGTRKIIIE